MPEVSSFARIGDALFGDSELEYQKGLQTGANTENALAMASERRNKARAQSESEEALVAAGVPRSQARAASVAQQAGGSFKDVGDVLAGIQERGFRDDAAGVTGLDFATGNRRAMGFASGPVDRFQKLGGAVDDRFDEAGPVATPGVGDGAGGGDAAFIQAARAYGLLDPETGRVREGIDPETGLTYRQLAYAVQRTSERGAEAGGVPYSVDTNVFSPQRGTAKPVVTPQETGTNASTVTAIKDLPASFQRFRNQSAQADLVMGQIDKALTDTSWASAGPAAWVTRGVAGTPAFALDQTVNSIKSNVGFQQLQQMRYESPTGGALGNVTVQELEFLQSALSSLNTAQNPQQLTESLAKVRDHYTRFKEYAAQDYELAQERASFRPPAASVPAPAAAPAATPSAAAAAAAAAGAQTPQAAQTPKATKVVGGKTYVTFDGKSWFEDDGT
jgi:hypothetical protein